MTLNTVDLPAPLGPMIPATVPRRTASETLSTASSPPKRTRTSSTTRRSPTSGTDGNQDAPVTATRLGMAGSSSSTGAALAVAPRVCATNPAKPPGSRTTL